MRKSNDTDTVMKNKYKLILGIMLLALLAGGSAMAQSVAQGVQIHGHVFGGGNAADVKINTTVNIGGGTIDKNVYGGGNLGDVGIIDKTDQKDGQLTYNYKWKKTDGSTANTAENNKITGENTNTGICKVTITGGTIGTGVEMSDDGTYANGNVFGAGKGLADTWWCEKAIVFATNVTISAGMVKGTVYGGGEVGRVEDDAKVTIGEGANAPTITGNVFGAGAGIKTHGYSALVRGNSDVTVQGGAKVGGSVYGGGEIASVGRFTVVGGLPKHPDSGGTCKVTIKDNAKIGTSGTGHNVFGACKGVTPAFDSDDFKNNKSMQIEANRPKNADGTVKAVDDYWNYVETYDEGYTGTKFVWVYYRTEAEYLAFLKTLALTSHPYVTIGGNASVYGSVYGGGERGVTLGRVNVDITGGTVAQDVYGGGALADTNLGNWDENGYTEVTGLTPGTSSVKGLYTRSGEGTDASPFVYTEITEESTAGSGTYYSKGAWTHETEKSAYFKTHVSLTGGTISGDAYGGGLGQKEYGTKGQTGYASPIEAMVYGDVLVELNGKTTTENSTTTITKVADTEKGCYVNRVFGCNNLNGTPKGKAQVYVYATQSSATGNIKTKTRNRDNPGENPYDVQAVYGGGNLAKYEPVDATLIYNETNKAVVDAARTEVIIDGCAVTSIKQVYGGGNAAPAPATYVEVITAYEIDEVFGGGNGYDNYSLKEGASTVYYQNPGANVGYYTYSTYPKTGTDAGAGTLENPWKAVEIPEYSGGSEHKDARLAATDIQYGSGIATLLVEGGTIHTSYGGSNSKGNVRAKLASTYSSSFGDGDPCAMAVGTSYGGGKNAYSDADAEVSAECAKGVKEMFGGSKDADFDGNINLTITNGSSLERVFGGNNTSGAVNGSITITIEEGGCEPIRIGELYLGGFLAPYSVYGYENRTESVSYIDENDVTQHKDQRIPLESGTRLYDDPRINVISATYIGKIFGGGYQAKLVGNPHINVNMKKGMVIESYAKNMPGYSEAEKDDDGNMLLPIGTIGDIYGGGNMADIIGNTYVEIGTGTWVTSWDNDGNAVYETITPARNAATITGNVFGGGKGIANTFECEKAMVGQENGEDANIGNTNVIIGNGTVGALDENGKLVEGTGNVYGGGRIGRVEWNTNVRIGLDAESGTSAPIIRGNVFGAGKGDNIHGYAALVRGNSTVIVQNNAKVGLSVYGGGEIASVGKYQLDDNGFPYSLVSEQRGICTVTVKDNVEIGPNDMKMHHTDKTAAEDKPDNAGHVFGGGKGILPYVDMDPRGAGRIGPSGNWEDYNNNETKYFDFIKTLALVTQTTVNIGEENSTNSPFIKGSVYGGSENGLIQHDTHVYIRSGQIGNGDGINRRYTAEEWAYDGSSETKTLKECAHWKYEAPYAPYDPNANATVPLDKYPGGASTEGGRKIASDGHTYYGNVFGGGSGSVPYLKDGISKYNSSAGTVEGDTYVEISGGHILTNVYGGCEATNVMGTANVTMTGGTIGVPRTDGQILAHPVTCNLFGAGKGDQRIYFNKETNVNDAVVTVSGGRIYGSVFGGGEDGHILRNSTVNISGDNTKIGTRGTSYMDGNVFGGGRGFGGEALTAGNVGGAVEVTINDGSVLGSVYGGGRLASVGYGLYLVDEEVNGVKPYGTMRPDDQYDGSYTNPSTEDASTYYNKGRGKITININGGTIGNDVANAKYGGNVFGGSMGSVVKQDGTSNTQWDKFATAKKTTVNVTGGTIKRSVYGGGEMGTVTEDAIVTVSAGTIGAEGNGGVEFGNVYGGGKGYFDQEHPEKLDYVLAGIVKGNTNVTISGGTVYHNIYGGGAYGSVGDITLGNATYVPGLESVSKMPISWVRKTGDTGKDTGTANVTITGGTIGTSGLENGMIFGSSRGDVSAPGAIHDHMAWVYDAIVTIGDKDNPSVNSPLIRGSIYGSGENGHIFNDTQVDINGGTIGILIGDHSEVTSNGVTYIGADYPSRGNVYGGGCGTDKYDTSGDYVGDTYNPLAGVVLGTTTVNVKGGHVAHNIYGAGAMGSVGNVSDVTSGNGKATINITGGRIGDDGVNDGNIYGSARGDLDYTKPNLSDLAQVKETDVNISYTNATASTSDNEDRTTQLIAGSVFGGGEAGIVTGSVAVDMEGGLILHDLYGGGAMANSNTGNWNSTIGAWAEGNYNASTHQTTYNTAVALKGGIVNGNVYGGGLGRKEMAEVPYQAAQGTYGEPDYVPEVPYQAPVTGVPAKVYGNVTVKLNENTTDDNCAVKGNIFGCNNLNGSPQSAVTVHIFKTSGDAWTAGTDLDDPDDSKHHYHLAAVYGGGNQSAFYPDFEATRDTVQAFVIIDGCDLTSIRQVYGGGNAASSPATSVTVNSVYEIEEVFGGGNGYGYMPDGSKNPGANVGYEAYGEEFDPPASSVAERAQFGYGSGVASVNIFNGRIHRVFGGSNTKGNVRKSAVTILEKMSEDCVFIIDEVYGGGKSAPMDAEAKLLMSCIPGLKEVYGGAQDADINNNVVLNITNGEYDRVFGGNNKSGTITGAITVNIEETGCKPVIIGQVYGGGNLAAYNGPWVDDNDHSKGRQGPTVNVKAFTSIGEIYGGGYGNTAVVTGDTHVNVNEVILSNTDTHQSRDYSKEDFVDATDPTKEYKEMDFGNDNKFKLWYRPVKKVHNNETGEDEPVPAIGVIGNVFGGGNAAPVEGNTYVNIGDKANETIVTLPVADTNGKTNSDPSWIPTYLTKQVKGVDIRGNVYGGGNNAEVTGNTNVVIGKRSE